LFQKKPKQLDAEKRQKEPAATMGKKKGGGPRQEKLN